MEADKINKAVKSVVDTNESLVYQVMSINEGSLDYDAVVYKLLRTTLSITSRLEELYKANEQKVKLGQLIAANDILAKLFKAHVETDNYDNF